MRTLWEAINDNDDTVLDGADLAMLGADVKRAIESVYGPLTPDKGRYARPKLVGEVGEKYFQDYEYSKKSGKMTYIHTDGTVVRIMKSARSKGIDVKMDKSDHHYSEVDERKYYMTFARNDVKIELTIIADSTRKYGVDTIGVWADDDVKKYLQ